MATQRLGLLSGDELDGDWIDEGTLARTRTAPPGPELDQLKESSTQPTPVVVAFFTLGDTRFPGQSPHTLSKLFEGAAKKLEATLVISAKDATAAKFELENKVPVGADKATIARLIFCGHAGPSNKIAPVWFAFSGDPPAPPAPPDLHQFFAKQTLSSDLPPSTKALLDSLYDRFTPKAVVEIWFVTCYIGKEIGAALKTHFESKPKHTGVIRGYTGEIGFGWSGNASQPLSASDVSLVKANATLPNIGIGFMQWDESTYFSKSP